MATPFADFKTARFHFRRVLFEVLRAAFEEQLAYARRQLAEGMLAPPAVLVRKCAKGRQAIPD